MKHAVCKVTKTITSNQEKRGKTIDTSVTKSGGTGFKPLMSDAGEESIDKNMFSGRTEKYEEKMQIFQSPVKPIKMNVIKKK